MQKETLQNYDANNVNLVNLLLTPNNFRASFPDFINTFDMRFCLLNLC